MANNEKKTHKPIVFDWKSVGINLEEIRVAEGEEYSTLKKEVIKAEERLKAAYDFRRYAYIATEKGVMPEKELTLFPSDFVKNARINLAKKDFEALKAGVFSVDSLYCYDSIKTVINRTKRTIKDYSEDEGTEHIKEKALNLLFIRAKKENLIQEFKRAKENSIAFELIANGWGKEAVKKYIKEGVVSWEELSETNKELAEKIKSK